MTLKVKTSEDKIARLIKQTRVSEGSILNSWFDSRLIRKNQNVLVATTGTTGSGKSYFNLALANHWYQKHFGEQFPIGNCCFSIGEIMERLNSKKLRKGELLIHEESGTSLNSLDFQNKVSKMFTFVLQAFRSMNVGVLFNLPVLNMLNKSTRLLIHCHFITNGIDYETEMVKVKGYRRQINQKTGKIYDKHFRIRYRNQVVPVKSFSYSKPPKELIDAYEQKKLKFVSELNKNFLDELRKDASETQTRLERNDLTEKQKEVYDLYSSGCSVIEIASKIGISSQSVYERLNLIKKKGYKVSIDTKSLRE